MTRKITEKEKISVDPNRGYHRSIGYHYTASGKRQPKKFFLGRDEKAARLAVTRLQILWENIAETYENLHNIVPVQLPEGAVVWDRKQHPPMSDLHNGPNPGGPFWDDRTLKIAEAIRKGQNHVQLTAEELGADSPSQYANVGAGPIRYPRLKSE